MKTNEPKSRNYCFTINNYTQDDLDRLQVLGTELSNHHYLIFGLEVAPETSTKHIQGYIQLNEAQRFNYLQKYFNLQRNKKLFKFHIEIANGTPEQNIKYCSKDGDFYAFGTPQSQGKRTDMTEIKELIKANPKDIVNIIDSRANNLQQLKFAQSIQPIYLTHRNPELKPQAFWIFGATGIGKTSLVYKSFTDICSVSSYDWLGTGYNQNECFLMDDFRPENLRFEMLLKLTDRYPLSLYFKGGQIPFNSPYIVITSPKSISETFVRSTEDLKQLRRRVTEIHLGIIEYPEEINLKNLDKKYIWNNVNESLDNF